MKRLKHYLLIIFALTVMAGSMNIAVFAKSVPLITQIATVNASALKL